MNAKPCLVLALWATVICGTLAGCASVPDNVARELAPPDGTTPDHFRVRGNINASP